MVDGSIKKVVTKHDDAVNNVGAAKGRCFACSIRDSYCSDEVVFVLPKLRVVPLLNVCWGLEALKYRVCASVIIRWMAFEVVKGVCLCDNVERKEETQKSYIILVLRED